MKGLKSLIWSNEVGSLQIMDIVLQDRNTSADLIHWMACQEVTSHTSSISVIVSRNSSNPSLWCGVVNLGRE